MTTWMWEHMRWLRVLTAAGMAKARSTSKTFHMRKCRGRSRPHTRPYMFRHSARFGWGRRFLRVEGGLERKQCNSTRTAARQHVEDRGRPTRRQSESQQSGAVAKDSRRAGPLGVLRSMPYADGLTTVLPNHRGNVCPRRAARLLRPLTTACNGTSKRRERVTSNWWRTGPAAWGQLRARRENEILLRPLPAHFVRQPH